MNLLPESARQWQQRVREFVDTDLIPWEVEAEFNAGQLPENISAQHRARARELGLHRIDTPTQYGGLELPILTQTVIWEQLGRVTNALGWCFNQPQQWMFEACNEDQLNRYILPLLSDARHECYALTEAESGSEMELKTTARHDGDSYVVNGEKWFVTSANFADYFILQARLDGGNHDGEHVLLFIDADTPGVHLVNNPPFSHTFAAQHPIYEFRDVQVPARNRIGAEGDGMTYIRAWFRYERLMIAARCCGAAQRLIEAAQAFADSRRVAGQPLSRQQAIQHMLADSATELWAARLMTHEAAAAHDRGADTKALHTRCSMAKLYSSEMANRVADRAVQIFGGRGYMRENVAERFCREVRVDRIWEGTSEVQRNIIAAQLLKRGLDFVTAG
ncbi:MAG: acyl-CoA/acyl-ACP dehydrogenase [Gammaproteobacteria bacterium]|nr:acyl-CoA/acyl-ACP dehydrogenase [Gammaproteobacteria bacterium]MDH3464565.1 acyl-CoA/acyl-ACP dehydrogenase [Gammaproteobacteria bacterium]